MANQFHRQALIFFRNYNSCCRAYIVDDLGICAIGGWKIKHTIRACDGVIASLAISVFA